VTDWPDKTEVEAAVRDVLDGRPELYPHWCDAEHVLEAEVRRCHAVIALKDAQLLMIASAACGDPRLDPRDWADPRWTPALEAVSGLRETIRLMSENERALQLRIADLETELGGACTCGSGQHPRACKRHPDRMALHAAKIDNEAYTDDLKDAESKVARVEALLAKETSLFEREELVEALKD
jgi:hypothetical protein